MDLKEKIKNLSPHQNFRCKDLPDAPGVYLMKNKAGQIIYIGKAKSLKKRVSSYFNKTNLSYKTDLLISSVSDIDFIVAKTETESLLLESRLVKKYQPKFNVELRDDKSFPYLAITKEAFPRIFISRPRKKINADFYGPYTNTKVLKQALKSLRRIFGYRSCKNLPKRPCLYWKIKLCPAPCIKKISSSKYKKLIKNISLFLQGKYDLLIENLKKNMFELAGEKKFEQATVLREQIRNLGNLIEKPALKIESDDELNALKKVLSLRDLPCRIEAFDISNISGFLNTASMVSFSRGKPDKNNYRRYRIKSVSGPDDYKSLKEVLCRRYSRLKKENLSLPDLILIDGGKGQLNIAKKALGNLKLDIPIISIAKGQEKIYYNKKEPIILDRASPALHLIQKVRDEAHRFARAYHLILRKKDALGKIN